MCLAREELEIWMLALHRNRVEAPWGKVRADCKPSESFAEELLDKLGRDGPGEGRRKRAMRAIAGQHRSLLSMCDELQELAQKLTAFAAR